MSKYLSRCLERDFGVELKEAEHGRQYVASSRTATVISWAHFKTQEET